MYNPAELQQLPVMDYRRDVRPNLQSGDLLFAAGNYEFSQLIERTTSSLWSHVGIIFRLNDIDRVLLLESVEVVGVRFAPLSKYLVDYMSGRPYDGQVYVARYDKGFTVPALRLMADAGCDRLARPYDMQEVVSIAARLVLDAAVARRQNTYICSELVYDCFQAAGITFPYAPRPFVAPEDIARHPNVTFLYRLL